MSINFGKLAGILIGASLMMVCAWPAWANLPANTVITNTATLSYWDGAATRTATSSATVQISLVPAGPEIITGPNPSKPYAGTGTTLTNSFIVRANSNGPDDYQLTTAISSQANTGGATATITSVPNPIRLGATLTLSGSSQQILQVPADGTSDNSVNGIEADDFVYIINDTYQVLSVADVASGTSTITLNAAKLLPAAPGAGVLIREEKTVTVDVVSGPIITGGSDVTVEKTLTATATTAPKPTTTSAAIKDTFTSGSASLVKYVRNTSQDNGNGASTSYGGNIYYRDNVFGSSGQTLEYLLVANNASSADVTQAVVNDLLPTTFVTLRADAYGAGREVNYVDEDGTAHPLSASADADAATYAGSTLTVYVGGATPTAPGGTIPGGNKTIYVIYQVTINP